MDAVIKKTTKAIVVVTGFWAAMVMTLTSGCASGGFKLTRQYAGFVNRQQIIVRIILYILTMVVFAVTVLVDMVIFNTMDFWDGKVSQGTFNFKGDNKTYFVEHKYLDNGLRQSTIVAEDDTSKIKHTVVLQEKADKMIDVLEDGVLKAQVSDLSFLPKITYFNKGKPTRPELVQFDDRLMAAK